MSNHDTCAYFLHDALVAEMMKSGPPFANNECSYELSAPSIVMKIELNVMIGTDLFIFCWH